MSKNSYMEKIGKKAKLASLNLSSLTIDKKNSVLKQFNQYLKTNERSILDANKNADRDNLLSSNHHFNVIGQEHLESNNVPNTGLNDIHQLSVLPFDTNKDAIPDNMDLTNIINPSIKGMNT